VIGAKHRSQRSKVVLRKTMMALCALVLVGMLLPDVASARGGFGGGGFRGGGFARGVGWGGAGFRGNGWGWRGPAIGIGVGLGLGWGLGLAGGYYGYPLDDSYDYPYGYGEYAEYGPWAYRNSYGGCYVARQRVWTSYGWRWRNVRACD
jgi:hypothetical protein